jgi:hypothetical protein
MRRDRSRLSTPLGLCILALALPAAPGQPDPLPYEVQPIAGPDISLFRPNARRPPLESVKVRV